MASYMRPSTRAVSLTVSLWPMCEPVGPMNVTCAPWSYAATSNAQRVRVESFSKISTISLPASFCSSRPSFFAAFNSAARSRKYVISSAVKSTSVRKLRPRRSMTVLMSVRLLSGVADDGTRHAVAASAPTAQLLAGDRVHLDAGGGELHVGRLVALVPDDDSGRKRDDVVAVVPLIALGLERVAACGDDTKALEAERVCHLVDERPVGQRHVDPAVAVAPVEDRQDLVDHGLVDRDEVAVAERENGVEMHCSALARHERADDESRGACTEEVLRKDAHRARGAALPLTDED